ncbi:hypothetical protein, conserved [Plasmodium gonderi]|uniref:Uncharacterized protein n=1 Tax=Plasmodium gonderi TaxID=77519 RepID=A0A1Y1JFN6_PLAGO|nr:hypothetical protein, conserved [Plasmodium gonderi]GAW80155.1 hypothetical protein, conserved [Plasmodium gonderi]
MPRLSYFIRKCKGKEGEKINEHEEVEIFSILNEDNCYSSDQFDVDSHVEENWNYSILQDNQKNKNRQVSNFSEKNGSNVRNYLHTLSHDQKEECPNGNGETSTFEKGSFERLSKMCPYEEEPPDKRQDGISNESNNKSNKWISTQRNCKRENSAVSDAKEQLIKNTREETLNNILLSKKSHIFHSIKILTPKTNGKNAYCKTKGKSSDVAANGGKRETMIEGRTVSELKISECAYDADGNDNHINEEFIRKNKKRRTSLNNIYTNFTLYENKVKQIEKKKKKIKGQKGEKEGKEEKEEKGEKGEKGEKEEKYDILFTKHKLLTYIESLKKHVHVSELYNDILGSINYFNKLKVREAYHSLRDIYIKKYANSKDAKIKKFHENVFVSEIFYRYKIMKKIEHIFNIYVKDTWDDFLNYSVISKRVYRNFIFDYLIDLDDVNGTMPFSKYTNPLSGNSNEFLSSFTSQISEEYRNDNSDVEEYVSDEKCSSYCSKEKVEASGETEQEDELKINHDGVKGKKLKKKKNTQKRENKRKHTETKRITNKYIDYGHFHLAYDDEDDNEVYYFVTKKEFNLFKQICSRKFGDEQLLSMEEKEIDDMFAKHEVEDNSDQFQTAEEDDEEKFEEMYEEKREMTRDMKCKAKREAKKRYTRNKKCKDKSKKSLSKSNLTYGDANEVYIGLGRNEEKEKSDMNTVIYFYVNLLIPSNFIYVIAAMIESTLFKSWIPFYSFPFKFGISECKTVKERGIIDKIVYTRIAMPWIIKDRFLLMDIWICEDFKFSKGIFLYASNFPKSSENMKNLVLDTDGCMEIDMTIHAFISPKSIEQTFVKCYVEISPNINLSEIFISFLTKVFIKSCISHFVNACKNFQFNEEYANELHKSDLFYDRLRKAAEECNIYHT